MTRINRKLFISYSLANLMILGTIAYYLHLQESNILMGLDLFLWASIHSYLLYLRALDMKAFTKPEPFPINISFVVGTIIPVLNLGIWFYYATEESREN